MLLSTLSIVLYIFINISGDLYAGSVYIKIALGWNTYVSIIGPRFEIKIYQVSKLWRGEGIHVSFYTRGAFKYNISMFSKILTPLPMFKQNKNGLRPPPL